MLKIRRSRDRLIFSMGIPIPGKDGLYIATGPWIIWASSHPVWTGIWHIGQKRIILKRNDTMITMIPCQIIMYDSSHFMISLQYFNTWHEEYVPETWPLFYHFHIMMAQHGTAVAPILMHWSYCSFALSHYLLPLSSRCLLGLLHLHTFLHGQLFAACFKLNWFSASPLDAAIDKWQGQYTSNRACHPGGHNWDYYPGGHLESMQLAWRLGSCRFYCLSGKLWYLQHNCVRDTIVYHKANDLIYKYPNFKWEDKIRGYLDSNSRHDCQAMCRIWEA